MPLSHRAALACAAALASAGGASAREISVAPYEQFSFAPFMRPLTQEEVVSRWRFKGDALLTPEGQFELTPDAQGKKGAISAALPATELGKEWRVDLTVDIRGRDAARGGDGLALWLTKDPVAAPPGHPEAGSFPAEHWGLGGPTSWEGLALFIDTFNNDPDTRGRGHAPYVNLLMNDGHMSLKADAGASRSHLHTPAGCSAYARHGPDETRLFTVRIEYDYDAREIIVSHTVGDAPGAYLSRLDNDWVPCFTVSGVQIPPGYFFGFSAATGQLSDAHRVVSMLVYPEERNGVPEPSEAPAAAAGAAAAAAAGGDAAAKSGASEHEGDDPGAPPHAHDTPAPAAAVTDDEKDAPPHSHEEEAAGSAPAGQENEEARRARCQGCPAGEGTAAACPVCPEQRQCPECPECPAREQCPPPQQCPPPPPLTAAEVDAVLKDAQLVRYLSGRVDQTATGLQSLQRQLDARVDSEWIDRLIGYRRGGNGGVDASFSHPASCRGPFLLCGPTPPSHPILPLSVSPFFPIARRHRFEHGDAPRPHAGRGEHPRVPHCDPRVRAQGRPRAD
jgi:hypothetical protein